MSTLANVLTGIVWNRKKLPENVKQNILHLCGGGDFRLEGDELREHLENILPVKMIPEKCAPVDVLPRFLDQSGDFRAYVHGVYHNVKERRLYATDGKVLAYLPMNKEENAEASYFVMHKWDKTPDHAPDYKSVIPDENNYTTSHMLTGLDVLTGKLQAMENASLALTGDKCALVEVEEGAYISSSMLLTVLRAYADCGENAVRIKVFPLEEKRAMFTFHGQNCELRVVAMGIFPRNPKMVIPLIKLLANVPTTPEKWWKSYVSQDFAGAKITMTADCPLLTAEIHSSEVSEEEKRVFCEVAAKRIVRMVKHLLNFAVVPNQHLFHDYSDLKRLVFVNPTKKTAEIIGTAQKFLLIRDRETALKKLPSLLTFYSDFREYAEELNGKYQQSDEWKNTSSPRFLMEKVFAYAEKHGITVEQVREMLGDYFNTAVEICEEYELEKGYLEAAEDEIKTAAPEEPEKAPETAEPEAPEEPQAPVNVPENAPAVDYKLLPDREEYATRTERKYFPIAVQYVLGENVASGCVRVGRIYFDFDFRENYVIMQTGKNGDRYRHTIVPVYADNAPEQQPEAATVQDTAENTVNTAHAAPAESAEAQAPAIEREKPSGDCKAISGHSAAPAANVAPVFPAGGGAAPAMIAVFRPAAPALPTSGVTTPRSGPALLLPRANMPTVNHCPAVVRTMPRPRNKTWNYMLTMRSNNTRMNMLTVKSGNANVNTRVYMLTAICTGRHAREHVIAGNDEPQ